MSQRAAEWWALRRGRTPSAQGGLERPPEKDPPLRYASTRFQARSRAAVISRQGAEHAKEEEEPKGSGVVGSSQGACNAAPLAKALLVVAARGAAGRAGAGIALALGECGLEATLPHVHAESWTTDMIGHNAAADQ